MNVGFRRHPPTVAWAELSPCGSQSVCVGQACRDGSCSVEGRRDLRPLGRAPVAGQVHPPSDHGHGPRSISLQQASHPRPKPSVHVEPIREQRCYPRPPDPDREVLPVRPPQSRSKPLCSATSPILPPDVIPAQSPEQLRSRQLVKRIDLQRAEPYRRPPAQLAAAARRSGIARCKTTELPALLHIVRAVAQPGRSSTSSPTGPLRPTDPQNRRGRRRSPASSSFRRPSHIRCSARGAVGCRVGTTRSG